MFYIYSGYVSEDNYDASESPIYSIREFSSKEEVTKFREEFGDECLHRGANAIFRVFEGRERTLRAEESVVRYGLE